MAPCTNRFKSTSYRQSKQRGKTEIAAHTSSTYARTCNLLLLLSSSLHHFSIVVAVTMIIGVVAVIMIINFVLMFTIFVTITVIVTMVVLCHDYHGLHTRQGTARYGCLTCFVAKICASADFVESRQPTSHRKHHEKMHTMDNTKYGLPTYSLAIRDDARELLVNMHNTVYDMVWTPDKVWLSHLQSGQRTWQS